MISEQDLNDAKERLGKKDFRFACLIEKSDGSKTLLFSNDFNDLRKHVDGLANELSDKKYLRREG